MSRKLVDRLEVKSASTTFRVDQLSSGEGNASDRPEYFPKEFVIGSEPGFSPSRRQSRIPPSAFSSRKRSFCQHP